MLGLPVLLVLLACDPQGEPAPDSGGSVEHDSGAGETGTDPVDADSDGSPEGEDCDDTNAAVHPGAVEVCDDADNDCNRLVDDGVLLVWYGDADGDGYGSDSFAVEACSAPANHVANAEDCDDLDADVSPAAPEVCNTLDDDCDGLVDDADDDVNLATGLVSYLDADLDGFGAGAGVAACEVAVGRSAADTDCNDADPAVSPAASEVCNAVDDDCDGLLEDADPSVDRASMTTWYADVDGDAHGGSRYSTLACAQPADYAATADDCDDLDASVSPVATEVCNGVDDDCDGATDDADGGLDLSTASTWYSDGDGDGHGDVDVALLSCEAPAAYVADGDDCDDTDREVSPDSAEVCNSLDDDCDGATDDADADVDTLTGVVGYVDADADGYGAGDGYQACEIAPADVSNGEDCDDGSAAISPAAFEVCDGVDDDCDAATTGCDGACDASEIASSLDCNGVCGAGDAGVGPDCDELCGTADDALSPDCDGAPVVSLSPASPDTGDDLVASTDLAGASWMWLRDGAEVPALAGLTEVPASDTTRGEVWEARATVGGLTGFGTVTIGNAAPTATITLSPDEPEEGEAVTATVATADEDGDAVSWTLAWTVDGVLVAETGATLDASYAVEGAEISVTVTPTDGYDEGTPVVASVEVLPPQCAVLDITAGGCAATASSSGLNLGSTYTVEAWAYNTGGGARYRRLLYYESTTVAAWRWQMDGDTTLQWAVGDTKRASATFSMGDWHHVAIVNSGSTLSFYLDGALQSSASSAVPSGTAPLVIGGATGCSSNWQGMIGPTRISNTARYTGSFTPEWGWTSDSSTQGLWNVDEGSGSTLTDGSGNGRDATISSALWTEVDCPG